MFGGGYSFSGHVKRIMFIVSMRQTTFANACFDSEPLDLESSSSGRSRRWSKRDQL